MSMHSGSAPPAPVRDKRSVLRAHPFFKDVSDTIIDMLAMRAVTRHVKKGTLLFRKGDAGPRLFAVCAGTVRISAPSEEGKDTIFRLIPAGEIFGEIARIIAERGRAVRREAALMPGAEQSETMAR